MGYSSRCLWIVVAVLVCHTVSSLLCLAWAQRFFQSPYSASDVLGRETTGLDLAPSNPLGMPTPVGNPGMDSILITPQLFQGILPLIPNLQAGYLYNFGKGVRSGRLTLDYLLPVELDKDTAVFGEFHNEWQDFWKTVTRGANHRIDLSIGGGFRKIFKGPTLLGVNGFYDTTRLGGKWYNSGGIGVEFAALLSGNDAVDLTFNWYGNLFSSDVLANAFRRGPQNYDFQAGYSHELWEGGPDIRLHATGYRFSAGSGVYGTRGGAELKTRDGIFSFKYEAAHDRINRTYHTVSGFVNVGIQLSNLLNGKSPFVMPEPIFRSPRNLRKLLTRSVQRTTGPPTSIVVSRATSTASTGTGSGAALTFTFTVTGAPLNWTETNTIFTGLIPADSDIAYSTWTLSWTNVSSTSNIAITLNNGSRRTDEHTVSFFATNGGSAGPFATNTVGGNFLNGVQHRFPSPVAQITFPVGTVVTLEFFN